MSGDSSVQIVKSWEKIGTIVQTSRKSLESDRSFWTTSGSEIELNAIEDKVVLDFDPVPCAVPLLQTLRIELYRCLTTDGLFLSSDSALIRGNDLIYNSDRLDHFNHFKDVINTLVGRVRDLHHSWQNRLEDSGLFFSTNPPAVCDVKQSLHRNGQTCISDLSECLRRWIVFIQDYLKSRISACDEMIRHLENDDRVWIGKTGIDFTKFAGLVKWERTRRDEDQVIISKDVFPSKWDSLPALYGSTELTSLSICSYNMKEFGDRGKKGVRSVPDYDTKTLPALVSYLKRFDVILLQELLFPLVGGRYSHSDLPYYSNDVTNHFHNLMCREGFLLSQSQDKTGTSLVNIEETGRRKGAEFFALYFRPQKVRIEVCGFIASDIAGKEADLHRTHNYTPYAWYLTPNTLAKGFLCLNVHFNPSPKLEGQTYRQHEMNHILSWLQSRSVDHRFVIAGDFNIQDQSELGTLLGEYLQSANTGVPTNIQSTKPYDHIVFSKSLASFVTDFEVGNLNFDHGSDHCPVSGKINL